MQCGVCTGAHSAQANIICDRETGRSRGYGFVTFDTEYSASEAMSMMQGVDVHGRRVRFRASRPTCADGSCRFALARPRRAHRHASSSPHSLA